MHEDISSAENGENLNGLGQALVAAGLQTGFAPQTVANGLAAAAGSSSSKRRFCIPIYRRCPITGYVPPAPGEYGPSLRGGSAFLLLTVACTATAWPPTFLLRDLGQAPPHWGVLLSNHAQLHRYQQVNGLCHHGPISPASCGSFIKAEPAPLFATLGAGQPILMSMAWAQIPGTTAACAITR